MYFMENDITIYDIYNIYYERKQNARVHYYLTLWAHSTHKVYGVLLEEWLQCFRYVCVRK